MIETGPDSRKDSHKTPVKRVPIWDLPTRLFHWVLAILFVGLWITGIMGKLDVHMVIGQVVLALLIFRVAWGFVGSRHSRFTDFVVGPKAGFKHLREVLRIARLGPKGAESEHRPGHTRLGGWMIVALLLLMLAQTATGLFATDEIATDGPLNHLVDSHTAHILTAYHALAFNLILALIVIHIAAALFYLLRKRENLIRPLITGRAELPADTAAREGRFVSAWIALVLLIGAMLVVWGITSL